MRSLFCSGALAMALSMGCSGTADPNEAAADGDDDTGSGSGNAGTGASGPSGSGGSGGFDPTGGSGAAASDGCNAVDVLFVIDDSGSMCTYQEGLVGAFPSFVDAMWNALPSGTDLHVGITTSGFAPGGSHSESNCVAQEPLETLKAYYNKPTDTTIPGEGFQGRLLAHQGKTFYAADTAQAAAKDGLKDWFAQAATSVGCGVCSFEFNASGAAYALHPANAQANAGFLRDEGAVLLIVILSDEADQSFDVDDPTFLHDTVTQAKSGCGGDSCIITAGLLSPWCVPDMNASYKFLSGFGEDPVWGDITGGNIISPDTSQYSVVIGDALAQVVEKTCGEIEPPK
jgi:hypothetical protein